MNCILRAWREVYSAFSSRLSASNNNFCVGTVNSYSFESFFRSRCAGQELRNEIKRMQEYYHGPHKLSPVATLAEKIAQEGSNGLRSLEVARTPAGISLSTKNPDQDIAHIAQDFTAVFFGKTISRGVEGTLRDGVFGINEYLAEIKFLLDGTPFSITPPSKELLDMEEVLSDAQWSTMANLATRDKTFSIFLKPEGLHALPKILLQLLGKNSHPISNTPLLVELQAVLPSWTPFARSLIREN